MPTYQLSPHQHFELNLAPAGEGFRIQVDDRVIEVEAVEAIPDGLRIRMDGRWHTVFLSRAGKVRWVSRGGRAYRFEQVAVARRGRRGAGVAGDGQVRSPMPGQVRAVHAVAGDIVSQGQTLMLLEAMKMEIRIQAPCDGVVEEIKAGEGVVVEKDQVLVLVTCGREEE
jgi:acetyl/propionyl-CoA carboxylase alpha subunit